MSNKYLTFILLLAFVPFGAEARILMDEADTLTINESVVSALRTSNSLTPAQTLSGDRLESVAALGVADALRFFSGLQVKDYGGVAGLKTVNVRSLGSQSVGVFYDGIAVGNAQNGQIDLGRFDTEELEAISLYNGQKTSMLQSAQDYASASSIYMESKTPTFENGRKNKFSARLEGGSFKTFRASGKWDSKVSEQIHNSLSASALSTQGDFKFTYKVKDGYDTTARRQNGDVLAGRLEETIGGRLNDGSWKAKAYFYGSKRGYPGAFVRGSGEFRNADRQDDVNAFVQGTFDKSWDWYRLSVKAKYAADWLHYVSDPTLDESSMYVNNTFLQQEAYLSAANGFTIFPWWNASIAMDWKLNDLDSNMKSFAFPMRNTLLTAASTTFHWEIVKLQASILHTWVHDLAGGEVNDRSAFSPSATLAVKPIKSEDFYIKSFYKDVYRMPTLNDMYYTVIGNRDLLPERSRQVDLGMSWQKGWADNWLSNIYLSADAYYNKVNNKIVAVPSSNQFQWTMMNIGIVHILGSDINAEAAFRLGRIKSDDVKARLRATYSYQRARDYTHFEDGITPGQIAYTPLHSCSAVASLDIWKLSVSYCFIYTGERYDSSANIEENYIQPWYTSDVNMNLALNAGENRFDIYLKLNNIFNQQYEVVRCYPMPGINFNLGIKWTL